MIKFEKDACNYLRLPSVPKKEWDGKSSFSFGVAVAETRTGDECYVVVSFDATENTEPQVKKVFGYDIIKSVKKIFVVPEYMDDSNVEQMDLDEESKKRVLEISKEAKEVENEGVQDKVDMPENEWFFDVIHDKEEAIAWLKEYYKVNKIKSAVPKKEETIKMRLGVIWAEQNNK